MAKIEQKPTIAINVLEDKSGASRFLIGVSLWGFHQGSKVTLTFVEVNSDDEDGRSDRLLGSVDGTIVPAGDGKPYSYSFIPDEQPDDPPRTTKVKILFSFAKPGKLSPEEPEPKIKPLAFALSDESYDVDEGDFWEVQVRAEAQGVASQVIPLARIRRQLENSKSHTYDWHDGHTIRLYHDGSDDAHGTAGAFHDLQKAIEDAKHLVFIADWSFQPLHRMHRMGAATPDDTIGAMLIRKAATLEPSGFLAAVHTWNHTFPMPDAENDAGDEVLDSIARGLGIGLSCRPSNLLWRATSREGVGWSHHQKFVLVDCATEKGRGLKVFFGGLDLTQGRFDWAEHVVSLHDPRAKPLRDTWHTKDVKFRADDWYNNEFADDKERVTLPRQPWHDIYMWAEGPCAWDFLREFVGRWTGAPSWGGDKGDLDAKAVEKVWKKYRQVREDRKTFVQAYEPKRDGIWALQVYRSLEASHWGPPPQKPENSIEQGAFDSVSWGKRLGSCPSEGSIEQAYRHAIGQAEKFIYIENQYLIGSGRRWKPTPLEMSNDVPHAIVDRILHQAAAGKPFHVYIVKPMFPEGDPIGASSLEIRHNEWSTIQYMVQTLAKKLGEDWPNYLSFYFLANWQRITRPMNMGSRKERLRGNGRYMVYVHSKFMIVDDRYFILGSANLNERGLSGRRDSEIACGVWPGHGHDAAALSPIRGFRKKLWQSHFGPALTMSDQPESENCISQLQQIGDANYRAFRTLSAKPNGHACRWPYEIAKNGKLTLPVPTDYKVFDGANYLPDCPQQTKEWRWDCPPSTLLKVFFNRELGQ